MFSSPNLLVDSWSFVVYCCIQSFGILICGLLCGGVSKNLVRISEF